MTKREITELLKTKFEGVGESKLVRIAEKIHKTNGATDEEATEAIEGVTLDQLLESYGDSRATEAAQTAIANYEKKHGLKDGKRADTHETQATGQEEDGATDTTTTKTEETKSDDTPAWAKALIEQNKALTERLNRMEGEKTRATRKEQLNGITGQLPAELRKAYDRIAVDTLTEDEFSALKEEIATEVSGINRQLKASGAVFTAPAKTDGEAKETLSKKEADTFLHAMNLTPTKKD